MTVPMLDRKTMVQNTVGMCCRSCKLTKDAHVLPVGAVGWIVPEPLVLLGSRCSVLLTHDTMS